MGSCLSAELKSETVTTSPCCDATCAGKGGNNISRSNSKVSTVALPANPQTEGEILRSPDLNGFRFRELEDATGNFSPDNLLGEGGFGRVYKGWVDERSLIASQPGRGMAIAVKKLDKKRCQGQQEWLAEIKFLGHLYHPNIVKLIGYCSEDDHRLLVYEFMPNGSLEDHLFRRDSKSKPLSWNLRLKVAIGAAKGLTFLHNMADVIFRDFKSSDILLDSNYNVKLSDFGLAKDGPVYGKTHISTRFLSIDGYTAPEASVGHVTAKSDVYSFGVAFLEMITRRKAMDINRPPGEEYLVRWASPYFTSKTFRIWDTSIEGQYSYKCMLQATHLVHQCLSPNRKKRPSMEEVVQVLEELYESSEYLKGPSALQENKSNLCCLLFN